MVAPIARAINPPAASTALMLSTVQATPGTRSAFLLVLVELAGGLLLLCANLRFVVWERLWLDVSVLFVFCVVVFVDGCARATDAATNQNRHPRLSRVIVVRQCVMNRIPFLGGCIIKDWG